MNIENIFPHTLVKYFSFFLIKMKKPSVIRKMPSRPSKDVTVVEDSFWNLFERDQTCFCKVLLQNNSVLRYTYMLL